MSAKRTALLLASMVALVAQKEQARAAFPSTSGKIVCVRDGARNTHIFMIKALKNWE